MGQVISSTWALMLGMLLLMVGNGVQGSLLGIRGEIEGFSTVEMSFVMSAYFLGFLGGSRLGSVFEGFGQILHASGVLDLVQIDRFRCVDVQEHLTIHDIVVHSLIPERVNHDDVLASVQLDLVVEKRERESVAKPRVDEFAGLRHEHNVEV